MVLSEGEVREDIENIVFLPFKLVFLMFSFDEKHYMHKKGLRITRICAVRPRRQIQLRRRIDFFFFELHSAKTAF